MGCQAHQVGLGPAHCTWTGPTQMTFLNICIMPASLPIPKLNHYMKNVRDKAGKVITRGEHISLERSLLQENKSVQTKTQS